MVTLSGASRKRAAGTNRQAGELAHTPQPPRDTSLTGDQLYSKGQSPLQDNQAAPKAVSLCASLRFHSNRSAPHTQHLSRTGRVRAAWNPRATRLQPAWGLPPRRLLGATPAPLQLRAQLPALPPALRLSSPSIKWAEGLLGRGGARGVRARQVWVLGPVIRAGPGPLPLSSKRLPGVLAARSGRGPAGSGPPHPGARWVLPFKEPQRPGWADETGARMQSGRGRAPQGKGAFPVSSGAARRPRAQGPGPAPPAPACPFGRACWNGPRVLG